MSINLVESIQKTLGFPELQKIDPNTQQVKESSSEGGGANLGQAAIPAVLMGLYKYGSTETGAEQLLRGNKTTTWLDEFFGDQKNEVVEKVSTYSNSPGDQARGRMEQIADEAVRQIRENVPSNASFMTMKTYVTDQRNNILVYLPAELQMSTVVNDNTLDDRTNKMEGPMSNSMHFIEKIFSGSSTEKYDRINEEDEQQKPSGSL
jgi:hypothetical protein